MAVPEPRPVLVVSLWLAALFLWASALFSRWPLRRAGRGTFAALAIVALGLVPRGLSLEVAPYQIASDEVVHPLLGMGMLEGDLWRLVAGLSTQSHIVGSPYPTQMLQAWPILFCEPLFGARLASLVLSVVSVLGTYALARRLFGAGPALIAVVLLVSSHWHMVYSRLAYPYMQPIALLPWLFCALLVGVEEKNHFLQFVAGILLGLAMLVYTPARIAVPIVALWFLHLISTRTLSLRQAVMVGIAVALGAAVFLSPYLHSAGIQSVVAHYQSASMGREGPLRRIVEGGWTSVPIILWTQLRASAGIYYSSAAPADLAPHDHSSAPLLDPLSLVLALLGFGAAVWNLRDRRCFLLAAWIGSTFILGQILTDFGHKAAYRAAPILPALAICGGWAAARIWTAIRGRVRRPGSWLDVAALLALAALILPRNLEALQSYLNGRKQDPVAAVARTLGRGPVDASYYVIDVQPRVTHFAVGLLGRGRQLRDVASLMDILGRDIDASRPAIFVVSSAMATAVEAIRRCYPSVVLLQDPAEVPETGVFALRVDPVGLEAGRDCAVSNRGPGLLARYTRGRGSDEELVRQRVEDWPVRFWYDPEPFQSVEWTGSLLIPVAGTYGFQLLTGGTSGSATIGSQIHLSENQSGVESFTVGLHNLRLRCEPGATTTGHCYLRWRPPGGDYGTIAPQFFLPPDTDR